jgi:hypothetical protein
VQIRNSEGKIFGKSLNLGRYQLPFPKSEERIISLRGVSFSSISSRGLPSPGPGEQSSEYRQIQYLIDRKGSLPFVLQIAVPTLPLERERDGLRNFLLLNTALTLAIALIGGLIVSRRAIRPIFAIIDTAARISAQHLNERLPTPKVRDEIYTLSETLNGLLDRLQVTFESQERFIADASHQLRTPLAILRGEIDLMMSRERSPQEMRDFLSSASQEIDHLSKMVQDLLLLARVDAGQQSLSLEPVRLDEIILDSVARLKPALEQKQIRVRVDLPEMSDDTQGLEIQGDPDLLRALFHNLIENCSKYSPSGSLIKIQVLTHTSEISVAIEDQGEGIPVDDREKVFARFFRRESQKNQTTGSGLGLAIARQIAHAHRGKLQIVDAQGPGTRFSLTINRF